MGAFPLLGLDRHTWNAENEQDLMALLPRKSQDSFSDWMMETVVPLYHRYIGQRFKVGLYRQSNVASNSKAKTT